MTANSTTTGLDPLTALLTRETFLRALRERLPLLRAAKSTVSFIFFDIDHFMSINTNYGHAAGDQVLLRIAMLTQKFLGDAAMVGRFGGDEFAALLPNTPREEALLMMDALRREIYQQLQPWLSETASVRVAEPISISIGIASCPEDGCTEYELMRKASEALYRAKVEGRNQIRLARVENMSTKTTHYTNSQLERLSILSEKLSISEAELLREAMDDLLLKYEFNELFEHPRL